MRRLFCLALLAAGSLVASEIAVAPPVTIPAQDIQHIAAASDGVDALVVWTHTWGVVRYGIVRTGDGGGDVGVRLLRDAYDSRPLAAFAGGRYMIAWQSSLGTEAALIDRDGNIVRRIGRFGSGGPGQTIVLAGGNGRFLLAWSTFLQATVAVISPDGDVLSTATFPSRAVAACESAGGFAVLLAPQIIDCPSLPKCEIVQTVARMDSDGRVVSRSDRNDTVNYDVPQSYSIASGSDGGLLVSWDDRQTQHALGFLTDSIFNRLRGDFDFGLSGHRPTTTMWDGSHYVVFTSSASGLSSTRVGIDQLPTTIAPYLFGVVVKVRGGFVGVTTTDELTYPIEASLHADLGSPSSATWHFPVVEDVYRPAIATDGHSVMAGWRRGRFPWNAYALVSNGSVRPLANFSGDEIELDGKEFVVLGGCPRAEHGCEMSFTTSQFVSAQGDAGAKVELGNASDLIWTGSLFFAFSSIDGVLTARRLGRSGDPIDRAPIVIGSSGYPWIESMATDGRDVYVVVGYNVGYNEEFALARVSAEAAAMIGDHVPFASPRIAVAGDVVFVTGTPIAGPSDRILVASYTADLLPRWPAPIAFPRGDGAAIAADGRKATVVWTERGRGVFGARVTPEGDAEQFTVIVTSDPIFDVRVAAGGGATAVAYRRQASEEPYLGAARMFVHFFPPPPRRRASAP